MASLNINAFEVAVDEISVNIVSSDTISAISSASFLNCRHSNSTDVNTTAQKKQVDYYKHNFKTNSNDNYNCTGNNINNNNNNNNNIK